MIQQTYSLTGTTCDHCVRSVTEEVSAIYWVVDVAVDLPTGNVTVTSNEELGVDDVRSAAEEAGYQFDHVTRSRDRIDMSGTRPPQLAQANLGRAMGTDTNVAIEASDLTTVRGDLRAAADAIPAVPPGAAHDQGQPARHSPTVWQPCR